MLLGLQVKQLADEIIAHIREVAGAEAMLAAYTEARKSVTATRMERKRRTAMQVWKYGFLASVLIVFLLNKSALQANLQHNCLPQADLFWSNDTCLAETTVLLCGLWKTVTCLKTWLSGC